MPPTLKALFNQVGRHTYQRAFRQKQLLPPENCGIFVLSGMVSVEVNSREGDKPLVIAMCGMDEIVNPLILTDNYKEGIEQYYVEEDTCVIMTPRELLVKGFKQIRSEANYQPFNELLEMVKERDRLKTEALVQLNSGSTEERLLWALERIAIKKNNPVIDYEKTRLEAHCGLSQSAVQRASKRLSTARDPLLKIHKHSHLELTYDYKHIHRPAPGGHQELAHNPAIEVSAA